MSETLALLGIGILLILSLAYLLFSPRAEEEDVSWLPHGDSPLPFGQSEDHRREQLERIFGREDWDFIRGSASEHVQRLFLRERKVIALDWISQLRSQARAGMHLHASRVRASEELQPVVEIKLAITYYAFLAKSGLISTIVLLGGPMALRGMLGQLGRLSDNLRGMLDATLKPEAFSQKTRIR